MKKISHLVILLLILGAGIFLTAKSTSALSVPSKLKGKILLQVESKGEAWYISPADGKRYSMGRPNDAFDLMKKQGIGISNDNLKKIQIANENLTGQDSDNDGLSDMAEDSIGTDKNNQDSDTDGYSDKDEIMGGYNPSGSGKLNSDNNFAKQQAGKIFLQVESKGEAWYVNPSDNKRYFLGRSTDAFNLMRKLGLGISNNDLNKIAEKTVKDCGKSFETLVEGSIMKSFNCLIESAKTCMPTKADITTTIDLAKMLQPLAGDNEIPSKIQTQRSLYEIRGITNGKCVYFTKLLDVQNPDMPPEVRDAFLGKEGETTCSYDSADLVARLKNIQQGNTSFSFSTDDTPAQRAAKQCQNYGALLATSPLTPIQEYNHVSETSIGEGLNYQDAIVGLTIKVSKISSGVQGTNWQEDPSADIEITSNKSANVQVTRLYVGKNTTAFGTLIELKFINLNTVPKQIMLKISSNVK